jgi:type IV pilus assembly protein PilE
VTRGKTTEATSALAGLRVAMEQCYQDNRTYVGCFVAPAPDDFAYAEGVPATATTAAVVTTATTYLLTATGAGSMAGYAYTIDQANAKTSTINGVAYACWVASPGSAC